MKFDIYLLLYPYRMSARSESPKVGIASKKRKYLTSFEKKKLLERFYQIPQPCSQREAADILDISQATFSRLIGNRFAKKIDGNRDNKEKGSTKIDKHTRNTGDSPRELKRLTTEEKLELLRKYDKLQPCSQRRAAELLKLPQSTLSDLLKSRKGLNQSSDMKQSCKVIVVGKNTTLKKKQQSIVSNLPPRKRRAPKRFDCDASGEISETSDEEYGPPESSEDDSIEGSENSNNHKLTPKQESILKEYFKLQKSKPCLQREAAHTLGISQSALSKLLRTSSALEMKQVLNSAKEKNYVETNPREVRVWENPEPMLNNKLVSANHRMRSLPEKIKIFRMFDAMQPCSQNKARTVFQISSSTLSGLLANRVAIEEEFRKQVIDNIQVLKKYDALEPHQLPRAHLICGLSKSKLDYVLENREFWKEEAAKNAEPYLQQDTPPLTEMERIENDLLTWYQTKATDQVTWMQLMNKAKELANNYGSTFVPDDPWMNRWKRKISHLLTKSKPDPRPVMARVNCVNQSSTVLPALKDFHPDNIFNLDETGLYYRAIPGYAAGKDDWVTVLFACNMSGTEKKNLTVVGKSEAPLFFGILTLPVNYKHSDDGKMSQEILSSFLQEWNLQLRTSKRNIALILDNCELHQAIDQKLECISLFFVSNNSASPSQPLKRGIIRHTKTLFRKKLFKAVNSLVNDKKSVNELVLKITLLDSLYMLAEAWEQVPVKIIINAFAELVFPNFTQLAQDEEPEEEIARLNQLDDDLSIGHSDSDERECLEEELSNEDYMVVHVEGIMDPSEDENEQPNSGISLVEGTNNPCRLESELRKFLDSSPGFGGPTGSSKDVAGSVKIEGVLGGTFCNDSGLSKSQEKFPPSSAEVHEALGVIKRFLRMNGGTLEDFTDFTQLEMKVLSKMKS